MDDKALADALDGLYAYDTGSVDSGIHDEDLRARCIAELHERSAVRPPGARLDGAALFLSRFVRDRCLSEEALADGYGIADVAEFVEWLGDRMEYSA